VALAILGIGAALTLSLISSALSNIRKVQFRVRNMHHAESVMELTLLDDSIREPKTLTGDFEDGTRWTLVVDEFEMPRNALLPLTLQQPQLPFKMLSYSVDIFASGSPTPDVRLRTLKLVGLQPQGRGASPVVPPVVR
jgi:hypothetical protein